MQWDAFNRTGNSHSSGQDCGFLGQDYGFGHIDDEAGCIWISDGCSASPNADVGPRLLTHIYDTTIFQELKRLCAGNVTIELVETLLSLHDMKCIQKARSMAQQLGLPEQCLDATLGFAFAPKGKHGDLAVCALAGDGAMVFGMADGTRQVVACGYGKYCPWFMNFLDNNRAVHGFVNNEEHDRLIAKVTLDPEGNIIDSSKEQTSIRSRTSGIDNYWHIELRPQKDLRFISLFTDGYEQISQAGEDGGKRRSVNPITVIDLATRHNNVFGDFVVRASHKLFEPTRTENFDDYTTITLGIR
jgi:hypothetical protein